jgi:hypothetical protein
MRGLNVGPPQGAQLLRKPKPRQCAPSKLDVDSAHEHHMHFRARSFPAVLFAVVTACSGAFEASPSSGEDASDGSRDRQTPGDGSADGFVEPPDDVSSSDLTSRPDQRTVVGDGSPEEGGAPPITEQGLLLWLRADVGVTQSVMAGSGGAVSGWADQSGNHLDGRQSDSTKQPKWFSTGLSGRPVVVFDTDDFLSLPAGFADFSQGVSLFAVVQITGQTSTCVDILDFSNGTEIDDIAFGRHTGKVHYEVFEGDLFGDELTLGRPHLASVVHGTDRSVGLRLDGAPFATGSFDLPATVTRLSNVVGRSLYAECSALEGGISELLVYNRALQPDERVEVESYLQSRWGCCR